jgi:hypothetical protein
VWSGRSEGWALSGGGIVIGGHSGWWAMPGVGITRVGLWGRGWAL